jgi:hypothetical protein
LRSGGVASHTWFGSSPPGGAFARDDERTPERARWPLRHRPRPSRRRPSVGTRRRQSHGPKCLSGRTCYPGARQLRACLLSRRSARRAPDLPSSRQSRGRHDPAHVPPTNLPTGPR